MFEVVASDGAARAGVLRTAHGEVPTPAFMPVGTKATVKSLHPDEVRDAGARILLGNTYHLHFRPGADVIAELGGLHPFMGWDGPILTDSGGFQVFSLRDTLLAVDDEGVTFRSVYDGEAARFTPELEAPRAPGQLVFGITQGAADRDLRARSVEEVTALDFDGYSLGGLSVGEP